MKRVLGAAVLILFLAGTVSADMGIGIKWYTETEIVNEGEQMCVTYGIYNPFDTDVKGYLEATKELETISQAEEPKLIPAHTSSTNAIPTQICFAVPKVYKEESFAGILTQRQCSEEEVMLKGEVVAAYKLSGGKGTGSVTGASFAAPLKLRIRCNPVERNWIPVLAAVLAISVLTVIILWSAYRKKRGSS